MLMKLTRFFFPFLISCLALSLVLSAAVLPVPLTGISTMVNSDTAHPAALPSLNSFVSTVENGQSSLLTGVYVPGVLAYPIVQQSGSDAAYVSTQPATLTQFRMAGQFNSIGLLAHDFLAGSSFVNLKVGNDVALIFGDGSLKYYQIYEIQRYQALSPMSAFSSFIDLSNKSTLSAEQLFYHTYGLGGSTLVFQTCISTNSVSSWGRLFVLARPVEASQPSLLQAMPLIEQAFTGASRTLSSLRSMVASR
jgi:hypothetical protein